MNVDRLLTQQGEVQQVTSAATVDKYGNPEEAVAFKTYRCLIQQSRRWEDTADRDQQNERLNLYLEPDAQIDGDDRIVVDDTTYQLEGVPWPAYNPRLRKVTHLECWIRRTA